MKNSKRFNEYLEKLSLIIYINENIQRIVENRDKNSIAKHLIDSINAANKIAGIYRYPYPPSEFFGCDDTEQKQTASLRMQSVSDETGFSSVSPNPRQTAPFKVRYKSEGFGDFNISGHEALIEYAREIHEDTIMRITEGLKIFRPV